MQDCHGGCSVCGGGRGSQRSRGDGLQEGSLECPGLLPTQRWEPASPRRCDENCLSCEGSSRNCSRCKSGFTQLGTSCVTNHTCSNGEPRGRRPGARGPGAPASGWAGRARRVWERQPSGGAGHSHHRRRRGPFPAGLRRQPWPLGLASDLEVSLFWCRPHAGT